jgi:Cu/Ag efflux pump CusA
MGSIPLAIASGAGSAGRRILGTTVVGGMLAATVLAIFLIPAMFALVENLSARARRRSATQPVVAKSSAEGDAH